MIYVEKYKQGQEIFFFFEKQRTSKKNVINKNITLVDNFKRSLDIVGEEEPRD